MKHMAIAAALTALIAFGCSKKGPAAGAERGPCYGNGTCNEGLLCLSDLCVRPPPADCNKVATKLNYLILGNYAKQEERDAYVARMVTECQSAHLTKEQGDCILGATDRSALAQCPKPLALGDCGRVLDHARKVLAESEPEFAKMVDTQRDKAMRECQRQGLTKEQETCILEATTKEAMESCVDF